MARNSDTAIVKSLLRAGANIDDINIRSVRPEFKKLIEASYLSPYPVHVDMPCITLWLEKCAYAQCTECRLRESDANHTSFP